MNAQVNNPEMKGQIASEVFTYGESGRYSTYAVHTRFSDVCWFTSDSQIICPLTGLPEIIRQETSFEKALVSYAN